MWWAGGAIALPTQKPQQPPKLAHCPVHPVQGPTTPPTVRCVFKQSHHGAGSPGRASGQWKVGWVDATEGQGKNDFENWSVQPRTCRAAAARAQQRTSARTHLPSCAWPLKMPGWVRVPRGPVVPRGHRVWARTGVGCWCGHCHHHSHRHRATGPAVRSQGEGGRPLLGCKPRHVAYSTHTTQQEGGRGRCTRAGGHDPKANPATHISTLQKNPESGAFSKFCCISGVGDGRVLPENKVHQTSWDDGTHLALQCGSVRVTAGPG